MNNIFFISYPRSGSHWLLNVIKELAGESWERFMRGDTDYESSIFIKSHCFLHYSGKTIYMFRNPKDTIFSWSKQLLLKAQTSTDYDLGGFSTKWIRKKLTNTKDYPSSFKDIPPESKNPKVVYHFAKGLDSQIEDRWAAHMNFYHSPPKECEVYYVRFETLIHKFKPTIKGVLEFCGLEAKNFEVSSLLQPHPDKIGQYKKSKFWTKAIDNIVEKRIGKTIRKYRY